MPTKEKRQALFSKRAVPTSLPKILKDPVAGFAMVGQQLGGPVRAAHADLKHFLTVWDMATQLERGGALLLAGLRTAGSC
jgi:hypothetical protein